MKGRGGGMNRAVPVREILLAAGVVAAVVLAALILIGALGGR
jgi:hypothetical protein